MQYQNIVHVIIFYVIVTLYVVLDFVIRLYKHTQEKIEIKGSHKIILLWTSPWFLFYFTNKYVLYVVLRYFETDI